MAPVAAILDFGSDRKLIGLRTSSFRMYVYNLELMHDSVLKLSSRKQKSHKFTFPAVAAILNL